MKRTCLILLCLLAISCTKDRGWDNPSDPEGTAKPTALSGLKAVDLNDSTIELRWQDSEGEMGYKIERSIDGGPMQEIASVSQDHTRFADTGLKTDHHYGYRVRAFAANGEETKTDTEFQHVFPIPSDLVLTQISDSEIRIRWKDNSVFESGFKIERKEGDGGFSQVGSAGSNVTSYVDKGLHTGKTYTYRVKAFTSINESAPVTRIIQHVLPAPSNLLLTQVSVSHIRLTWKDNSTFESGFRVERKEGATGAYDQIVQVGPDIQTYTDSDVPLGTEYTYRVCAFTPSNESPALETSLKHILQAPTDLNTLWTDSSVLGLSWTDNSAIEDGFIIERKEGAKGSYVEIGRVGANTTNYTENVSLGMVCYYRVKAYVQGQASSCSNEVAAGKMMVNLPGGATMEMVWIEPGTFMMGLHSSGQDKVTITQGFWLSKYEVTRGQWASVAHRYPWMRGSEGKEGPNYPAIYVSWTDVQGKFISELNYSEGSDVYRLPTEAEWEYACRAGTTTRWSFGNDESQLGQYAWYKDNAHDVGEKNAHEMGQKLPNPWGLYDMHGNVAEWVQDLCGSDYRVVRGGSWFDSADEVRSAYRYCEMPYSNPAYEWRLLFIGFRLVRSGP